MLKTHIFLPLAFLFAQVATPSVVNANLQVSIDSSVSESAALNIQEFIDSLPLLVKQKIGPKLKIQLKHLGSFNAICVSVDKVNFDLAQKLGQVQILKKKILIDHGLISALKFNTQCKVQAAEWLRYTLAIQIASLFDQVSHLNKDERRFLQSHCNTSEPKTTHSLRSISDCKYFNRKGYFSGSKQFFALANFKNASASKNHKWDDTPLESTTAKKYFSEQMANYLTAANYACQRPALHKYYTTITKDVSTPRASKCPSLLTTVFVRNDPTDIHPNNVYQIHYFFAGRGDKIMSHWGHAMFRLVTCKPGRALGPDCLKDIRGLDDIKKSDATDIYAQEYLNPDSGSTDYYRMQNVGGHKIISFRANTDDIVPSYIKGLFGKYPSQLFILNQHEVVSDYTRRELREITSLPLNLTRDQIELFIYKVLEDYYIYRGKYYFLGNNCATESLRLLRAVLTDQEFSPLSELKNPVHPLAIYKALSKSRLANIEPVLDKKLRENKGYYYRPFTSSLENAFTLISKQSPSFAIQFKNFKEWAAYGNAASRSIYIKSILDSEAKQNSKIYTQLAFKLIEEYRLETLIYNLKDLLAKGDEEFQAQAQKIIKKGASSLRGTIDNQVANINFGESAPRLPLSAQELYQALDAEKLRFSSNFRALKDELIREFEELLGPLVLELKATQALIDDLRRIQ